MLNDRTRFLLLFFLFLPCYTISYAQEKSATELDSASFLQSISKLPSIPGVSYRLNPAFSMGNLLHAESQETIDSLAAQGSDYEDFSQLATLIASQNLTSDSATNYPAFQILLNKQPSSWIALREHVQALIADQLLDTSSKTQAAPDLITLAHKTPYLTSKKKGFGFFTDLKVFIITIIISVFGIVTIAMIVFMVFYKVRKNKKERLKSEYDGMIVTPLSEILFDKNIRAIDDLSDEELNKFFPAHLLNKPLYQSVLIGRIISLNKSMKGDFKAKLKALYKRLGLDQVSLESLASNKWDRVVSGLVQINEMDLYEAVPEVKKLVNSSNFYIRSQAVATLLNISTLVDLNFLRDQTFPLSRWQQMNYLRIIRFLHTQKELHLESLFDSENQSIRIFSYKLVRQLGRVDLVEKLVEKYDQVEDVEKIEMLQTFLTLVVPIDPTILHSSLTSDNEALVYKAVQASGIIGEQKTADLLWELLPQFNNFKLIMAALKSLLALNEERYNQFIAASDNADYQAIHNHLLDPILQDV